MPPADAIRKHGFRRWCERQLYESHAFLVAGFLCLIMMAIAFEESEFRKGTAGLLVPVAVAIIDDLRLLAWRQFNLLLCRAEHLAEQATRAQCHTCARFVVAAPGSPDAPAARSLDIRCRKCGRRWAID
jgi:hypothetical protein